MHLNLDIMWQISIFAVQNKTMSQKLEVINEKLIGRPNNN